MQLNKIPATVVTGFLGSGKTTLLSNVLKQAKGKRIAVIVNEFGELDIDADLLRNSTSTEDSLAAEGSLQAESPCPLDCEEEGANTAGSNGIYELANGCICCTVEEEFLPVMQQLVERREDIDHILIETSGLALPKPLVQAFNWPEIKQHCTVDAVVTVIDGPAVAAGRFANDAEKVQAQRLADDSLDHDPSLQELLDDQLSAADLVIVSKNDLLVDDERSQVEQIVAAKVPDAVKTTYISNGEAPLEVLMGIEAAAEERIEQVHTHHDHHHDHGEHHEHAHDHFDSFVLSIGEVDPAALQNKLQALLKEHNIFRAKGFAAIPGKPMRQVIQAVGERIDIHFDRPWGADEVRKSQLVVIGKGIDQRFIENELKSAEV